MKEINYITTKLQKLETFLEEMIERVINKMEPSIPRLLLHKEKTRWRIIIIISLFSIILFVLNNLFRISKNILNDTIFGHDFPYLFKLLDLLELLIVSCTVAGSLAIFATTLDISIKGTILYTFKQIKNLFSKIVDLFSRKFVHPRFRSKFQFLGPRKNAWTGIEPALKYAIRSKDVHDIAITGKFGAGKSTQVRSFFENHYRMNKVLKFFAIKKNYCLSISLSDFFHISDDNKEYDEKKTHELELAIVKNIHSFAKEKIDERKRKKCSTLMALVLSFPTIYLSKLFYKHISIVIERITAIILLIKPDVFEQTAPHSEMNLLPTLIGNYSGFWIYIWLVPLFYLSLRFIFHNLLVHGINTAQVKLNLINTEIKFESKNNTQDNILSQNQQHILDMIKHTKCYIYVFEDLDRFRSLYIFERLRGLNSLLNKQLNDRLKFIYVIGDNILSTWEQKTKFFDFVIPVVPYSSSLNSQETLTSLLIENKLDQEFSHGLVNVIAKHISDPRLLTHILNEYLVYKRSINHTIEVNRNKFLGYELIYFGKPQIFQSDQLLSLVLYKNLFPNDFAVIESGTSLLEKINSNIKSIKYEFGQYQELIEELSVKQYLSTDYIDLTNIIHSQVYTFSELRFLTQVFARKYSPWMATIRITHQQLLIDRLERYWNHINFDNAYLFSYLCLEKNTSNQNAGRLSQMIRNITNSSNLVNILNSDGINNIELLILCNKNILLFENLDKIIQKSTSIFSYSKGRQALTKVANVLSTEYRDRRALEKKMGQETIKALTNLVDKYQLTEKLNNKTFYAN